jgi:azurin
MHDLIRFRHLVLPALGCLLLGCKEPSGAASTGGGASSQQGASEPGAAQPQAPAPAAPTPSAAPPAAPTAPAQAEPGKTSPTSEPAAPQGGVLEVHVTSNGIAMKFDLVKLQAKTGQSVHLVFENKPPGTLPHNWVLVRPGTEAAVALAGLKKGVAEGYLDPGPDVLASTAMTPPGKTSEVTFTAPAPGTYPYICTFPGHYMMMKGVLEVTP